MAPPPPRCINHPERNAVAKCKQCRKPLCPHCAVKKTGGTYCSDECFDKMTSVQKRVDTADKSAKRGFSIAKFVPPIITVAVVGGVLYFLLVVQEVRSVGDFVSLIKSFLP